jgi:excisionase family DNA binding protein
MNREEQTKTENEHLLTIGQVANRLQVSPSWLYRKAKAGLIPHIRIGSVLRFEEEKIAAWVNEHRMGDLSI